MSTFDILVAGEINPDLILTGAVEPAFGQVEKLVQAALTIGSSSVIFACGAAHLGLKVAFVGKCGDDVFGRFMLAEMQRHAVDVSHVLVLAADTTGLSVILNRGVDRAILTYPGLIAELQAADIPDELLRQARHLHVASYFLQTALQPGLAGLFRRAHALGLTTSLDTNYDPSEQWLGFDELLSATNIFLPNEAEACSLTGVRDAELAAEKLAAHVETLAVKLGAQGSLGMGGSYPLSVNAPGVREKIRVPSIPVDVVDTVGAGDSFDAGFIYAYLNHWSLEKSLRLANICGALSTRAAGGTAAQATLDEALAILVAMQTGTRNYNEND
jgi:sugar/nucleoside kinase (ribokinase family)